MPINAVALAALLLLALLFLKVPVFIAILSASVTYFALTPNIPQLIIAQRVVSGMQSNPLLAIPFFVCSGVFMNYTGVTQRIMNFCSVITRRLPGGLAQVNVLLSTIMGGAFRVQHGRRGDAVQTFGTANGKKGVFQRIFQCCNGYLFHD